MGPAKQTDWLAPGPATAPWRVRFLGRLSEGPVAWDVRWRRGNSLKLEQLGAAERENLCKILETLAVHDSLYISNFTFRAAHVTMT